VRVAGPPHHPAPQTFDARHHRPQPNHVGSGSASPCSPASTNDVTTHDHRLPHPPQRSASRGIKVPCSVLPLVTHSGATARADALDLCSPHLLEARCHPSAKPGAAGSNFYGAAHRRGSNTGMESPLWLLPLPDSRAATTSGQGSPLIRSRETSDPPPLRVRPSAEPATPQPSSRAERVRRAATQLVSRARSHPISLASTTVPRPWRDLGFLHTRRACFPTRP